MTIDQMLITVGGLLLSAAVAWYFWFSERKGVRVSATGDVQEILVRVKGGYSPDVIVVDAGKPVRVSFHREETALCSEQVIFPEFHKQATLTVFRTVPVEFTPDTPGEYGFQCGMGMLRGKIVVQ